MRIAAVGRTDKTIREPPPRYRRRVHPPQDVNHNRVQIKATIQSELAGFVSKIRIPPSVHQRGFQMNLPVSYRPQSLFRC